MLLERPLDDPIPDLPLPPGVTVLPLRLADVPAYLAFRPDQAAAIIERRLGDGEWGFAAWRDGAIVMASWTSPQRARIDYLDWELALAPDEAYSYDLYTVPAFRGRGLASAARVSMLRDARERGCRRLFSALLPENTPGWRTPDTLGFRQIGWIGYVGPAPWRHRFCRVAGGARRLASA